MRGVGVGCVRLALMLGEGELGNGVGGVRVLLRLRLLCCILGWRSETHQEAGVRVEGELAVGVLGVLGRILEEFAQRGLELVDGCDIVGDGFCVGILGLASTSELHGAVGPDALLGVLIVVDDLDRV